MERLGPLLRRASICFISHAYEAEELLERRARGVATSSIKNSRSKESDLLRIINQGLSEEEWERFKKLVSLRDEEQLTEPQHKELIAFTDRLEYLQARRIRAMGHLAKIRGVSFDELATQLDIGPRPLD